MTDKLVASFGPNGCEFVAPTYAHKLEGLNLAPKPEVEVTQDDLRRAAVGKEKKRP